MIESELLFLGLLKESPKHGYEIKKEIKEILTTFVGLDLKSIYYPLRVLEKKGFLIKSQGKYGRRPLRYTYNLTPRGEARFLSLLNKSFLDFKRPQFSLDLSLYFLKFIRPGLAKRRLKARITVLKKLSHALRNTTLSLRKKAKRKSVSILPILEHNLRMVESEEEFLRYFIKTL